MKINTLYTKYKINNLKQRHKTILNSYLLIDQECTGFFIGTIKEDVEVNPLNMDEIFTFYPIRKSDIHKFKNLENSQNIINAILIDLQINLQLNNDNLIYRR